LCLAEKRQAKDQTRQNEPGDGRGIFHEATGFLLAEQTDFNRRIGLLTACDHRFSRLNIY
jgi:hypothetical protein